MSEDINLVRSLYGDLAHGADGKYLFSDEVINGWLNLAEGNIYRAAAMACRALAVDQAYLLKVVRTDDLQVNGALVAAELRLLADDLDEQADRIDSEGEDSFAIFEFDSSCPRVPEATTRPWGFC